MPVIVGIKEEQIFHSHFSGICTSHYNFYYILRGHNRSKSIGQQILLVETTSEMAFSFSQEFLN